MEAQTVEAPQAPTEQPTLLTAVQAAGIQPETSDLPATHHEAYRMKLAGKSQQAIADTFGFDRVTIWRWTKAVEAEALQQLAEEPVFNLIVREVNRLTDLEEQAREGAEQTKSDRAKAMYLAEARRAAVSRQNLLITCGVFPKAPEQIYRVTAQMKPSSQQDDDTMHRTREEVIAEMLNTSQRTKLL